jgi:hypothetical protein
VDKTIDDLSLPVGFTTRPTRMKDAERVGKLYNEYSQELMGVEKHRIYKPGFYS